jgi:hypothetical protein
MDVESLRGEGKINKVNCIKSCVHERVREREISHLKFAAMLVQRYVIIKRLK